MGVLGRKELIGRLRAGEIFKDGTWEEKCVRQAAYDLRVAAEFLVAPDGTRYWPDNPAGQTECRAPFLLQPGEGAFVSTVEVLRMPDDVAGNIAQKFRLTGRGLLVMGGLLVDPCYGMERSEDGSWVPRQKGGRLHFQLANIGKDGITIIPGTTSIAGIQFLDYELKRGDAVEDPPNSDALLDEMFRQGDTEPPAQLAFFSEMRRLERTIEGLVTKVNDQQIELKTTQRSTDNLVVFGVFLIAMTLFTVAVAALLSALAGGDAKDALGVAGDVELSWAAVAAGLVLVGLVTVACSMLMRPVTEIFRARWRERPEASATGGAET